MTTVWVSSPSPLLAEALSDLLLSLGYGVQLEAGPDVEVMLCDLCSSRSPYHPAHFIPSLAVICTDASDEELANLLLLGYRGYLPPYSDSKVLKQAITAVAQGEIWASRRVTCLALTKALGSGANNAEETRIVALARQGLSNREIAEHLNVSETMVKSYLRSSYKKMGIHGRRDLFLEREKEES